MLKTVQNLLKFYACVQEIHRSDRQKNNLGQSNSLPIICILPLQRGRFVHSGLKGPTINSVSLTRWYINSTFKTRHRLIKAARQGRDKNGVLQCAMVSQLGHSLRVVTSSSRGRSNQPISFLKLRRDMALCVAEVLCATGGEGISCVCYMGAVHPKKVL